MKTTTTNEVSEPMAVELHVFVYVSFVVAIVIGHVAVRLSFIVVVSIFHSLMLLLLLFVLWLFIVVARRLFNDVDVMIC